MPLLVKIARALFLGAGRYATDTAATLDEARTKAARLPAQHPNGKRPLTDTRGLLPNWRRGWDSNPRTPCDVASFQDWCLQPLGHLSVASRFSVFARVAPLWPRRRFSEVNNVVPQWDTLSPLPVFKTSALNRSATLPSLQSLDFLDGLGGARAQ
jgi:hypothetical protein